MFFWIAIWWALVVYCSIHAILDNRSLLIWLLLSIILGPIALFLYMISGGDTKRIFLIDKD